MKSQAITENYQEAKADAIAVAIFKDETVKDLLRIGKRDTTQYRVQREKREKEEEEKKERKKRRRREEVKWNKEKAETQRKQKQETQKLKIKQKNSTQRNVDVKRRSELIDPKLRR